jgi:hypothetical protein
MKPTPVRLLWPDGQVRVEGQKIGTHYVGEYRSWTNKGTPREHAFRLPDGRLEGEALLFHHGEGRVAKRVYRNGVVVLDASQRAQVVRLIHAKHDRNDVKEILGRHAHADHTLQLLWDLVRRGDLPAHEQPWVWCLLSEDLRGVTGADVVALLSRISFDEAALRRAENGDIYLLLPFWPRELDDLVAQVYPKDPEPFRHALADLPSAMADGVRTVMARCGETVEDFERNMAEVLAATQLERELPTLLWWPAKNRNDRTSLPTTEEGWSDVSELVTTLSSWEAYLDALIRRALEEERRYLPVSTCAALFRHATREQLPKLLPSIKGRWSEVHAVVRSLGLAAAELRALAESIAAQQPHSDVPEVLRLAALAEEPDPAVLEHLTFTTWDRHQTLPSLEAVDRFMVPALERLPVEPLRARLTELLTQTDYGLPLAIHFRDDGLLERVASNLRTGLGQLFHGQASALALARMGVEGIPWMLEQIAAHENEHEVYGDLLAWSILLIAQDHQVPAEVRPLLTRPWRSLDRRQAYERELLEELQKGARKSVRPGRSKSKATSGEKPNKKKQTPEKKPASARTPSLVALAKKLVAALGSPTRVDLLVPMRKTPGPRTVSRAGGLPIGVDETTWPRRGGVLMEHLLTLDLRNIQTRHAFGSDAAAVAVFGDTRRGPTDTVVLPLTAADLKKGIPKGAWTADVAPSAGKGITIKTLLVPAAVFGPPSEHDDLPTLKDLLISQPGFAAAEPLWLQDPQDPGEAFGFQFDERLGDVVLGDSGVMYVFGGAAFFQCL